MLERTDEQKRERVKELLKKRVPPEPGTVGAEYNEAWEAYRKTLPQPRAVDDRAAHDKWAGLPEVRRYRRIKLIIYDIKHRQPELKRADIDHVMLSDVPEWTQSPYLLPK